MTSTDHPARHTTLAFGFALLTALLAASSVARADFAVRWDCFVESGPVTCANLERSFFASLSDLRQVDANATEPHTTVTVRSIRAQTGTHYVASFAGGPDDPAFSMREFVRSQLDADAALLLLVSLLQRGTIPFVRLAEPMTDEEGTLRLRPVGADADPSHPAVTDTKRWHLAPSLWGHAQKSGGFTANIGADMGVQWSYPTWQAQMAMWAEYKRLRYELDDEVVTGQFWYGGASARALRDVGAGFDVAIGGGGMRSVPGNLDGVADFWLGLEWLHRTWLETSGTNWGARVRAGGSYANYHVPNTLGETTGLYGKPWLQAFVRWHSDALDVNATLSAWVLVPRTRFSELNAYLEPTWHVTDDLEFSCWGSVTLRRHAVQEPSDPDALGDAATLVGGNFFGSVSYNAGLNATYVLGNSLLRSQDQRWR